MNNVTYHAAVHNINQRPNVFFEDVFLSCGWVIARREAESASEDRFKSPTSRHLRKLEDLGRVSRIRNGDARDAVVLVLNFDPVIVQLASNWRSEASSDLDLIRVCHERRQPREARRARILASTANSRILGVLIAVEDGEETASDDGEGTRPQPTATTT